MCTMCIDGFNGVAHHLAQNSTSSPPPPIRLPCASTPATGDGTTFGCSGCGTSTFKYDLRSEDAEGHQDSTISVFTRDRNGALRHVYSAHPWMAEDIKERGIDLLSPVYNLLDLTPEGRDDSYAKLAYPEGPHQPPR